jgi:hypothetical protein
LTAIALYLALFAPLAPQGDERAAWTALQVPSVCLEAPQAPYVARLVRGQHLLFSGDTLERESPSARPNLPLRNVIDWLQDEARRSNSDLRVLTGGPPLLVRGSAGAVSAAAARLAELERATQAFQVDLDVWLTDASATSTHPERAEFETATRGAAPWGSRRVRSGEIAVFGARDAASYLGSWSAEVANSSGVAEPKLVQALFGSTLHLFAARADGGTRVRLQGWLDLAEPGTTTLFDPETPDLGVIQQPTVHAVQVSFGGSVASGGVLAVALDGLPLSAPRHTLWIQARAPRDPSEGEWRAIDTAWLEAPDFPLPPVLPGAGLEPVVADEASNAGVQEPLSASSLAQVFEEARTRSSGRPGAAVLWAPGFLCVPRGETAANAELDLLLAAASKERGREGELVVSSGKLTARLPVSAGATVRLLAVTEHTVMTGYSVQIAAETWMPSPRVDRVADGEWLQGRFVADRLDVAGWSATSTVRAELKREEARLGRMQLVARGFRAERGVVDRAHPKLELLSKDGGFAGLALELVAR